MAKKNNQRSERICWVAKVVNTNHVPGGNVPKWLIVGHMFPTRLEAELFLKRYHSTKVSRIVGGRLPSKIIQDRAEREAK